MCFEYSHPKRQVIGAGQHKDPTANRAIGNLMNPRFSGSMVESDVLDEIFVKVRKRAIQRGRHGIFQGSLL